MSIVDSMKNLAKKGKTIVCTIHQPSSEIFEMFDKLYLMAGEKLILLTYKTRLLSILNSNFLIKEGRTASYGSLPQTYEFFSGHDYTCPPNYNPADYYIKTLAIAPSNKEESRQTVKVIS